jgi:hypothetical protein
MTWFLWLTSHLQSRRERREAIAREAEQLILFLDDMAYDEARTRARSCRTKQDWAGDRFWSQVAVEIARRTGRVIGAKAADRYEADRLAPRVPAPTLEHRLLEFTGDINRSLAHIAKGEHSPTELHNIGAAVRNAAELVPANPDVKLAGATLLKAAAELLKHPAEISERIREGTYPPELEAAANALEAYRSALMQTARL